MGLMILIFGLVCTVAGIYLSRPVPMETKQKQWKSLSRVDKSRLKDSFTEEERAEKVWPDDYRK